MSAFIFSPPIYVVAGSQGSSVDTFTRIGTFTVGAGFVTFSVSLSTTDPGNAAEVQLFDLGTMLPVPGSSLSTTSTTSAALSVGLSLPSSNFDVMLRLAATDANHRATCTAARIE